MGKKKSGKNVATAQGSGQEKANPEGGGSPTDSSEIVEAVDSLLLGDETTPAIEKHEEEQTEETNPSETEEHTNANGAASNGSQEHINGSDTRESVPAVTKSSNGSSQDLEARLAAAEARAERAEAERDDIQEEYDELCDKLSHVKATVGVRLKKDAENLEECRQALERAEKERDSAQAQINAHQMILDQSSQESESQRENLLTRIAKLEDDLTMEKQDVRRYKELSETLQGQIASDASRHSHRETELEHEIASARLAEKQAKQQHDAMKTELDTQTEASETLRKEHAGHEDKLKELENSVREKNLLIGKLRHEAVVLNDHLTNALRLVKKESEGQTVDKELVSNLFVQFATCPRADTKKFEILMLIADFLGWDEDRRTQVGLSRSSSPSERSLGGVFGKFAEFLERESKRK